MDWFYPKRRGPEWKQGWTGQTLATVSPPPLPLLAIFAIVIFLLSLSQYTSYKEQVEHSTINFQLLFYFAPVILILLLMRPSFNSNWFNFRSPWARDFTQGSQGSPWGVAALVLVLLILVSYQSPFHSKGFGSH